MVAIDLRIAYEVTERGLPANETTAGRLRVGPAVVPDADMAISVDVAGESESVRQLREAAAEAQVVHVTYRSLGREQETVRDIEPWNVFAALGNWYVQGHCRLVDGERVFRVDRIREMEVTDETFVRPSRVPEPAVDYSPSPDDVVCEIALGRRAMWVPDYYPVEVLKATDEETIVRFSSQDAEVPARLLLRLGPDARLISGEEVKKRVQSIGRELLKAYQ